MHMNEFNDDQSPASESLKHLAEAYGVSTEYWDYHGNLASPSGATLKAVLTALGVSARTDEEIERSLREVEDAPWRQTLAPTVVTRGGVESTVPVYVPDGAKVRVRVELEDGGVRELTQTEDWTVPREVDGVKRSRLLHPGNRPAPGLAPAHRGGQPRLRTVGASGRARRCAGRW